MLVALFAMVSCASAQDSRPIPKVACYRLEVDHSNPEAEGIGFLPKYLILEPGEYDGEPQPEGVLRVFRSGTKRSPFWQERGDSVFVFKALSKFT
jgi:hypothetical protein